MIAGGRGGSGGPPNIQPLEKRADELLEKICDLCHWPYVYHDNDIMTAEKCEYCPVAEGIADLVQALISGPVTLTFNIDRDAAIKSLDDFILRGESHDSIHEKRGG